MNRIIAFTFTCLLLIFNVACKKDFLDVPDKTSILRQAYVVDIKTTEDYLNGIYVSLSSNLFNSSSGILPEIISDNIKPISGGALLIPQYNWSQMANDEKTIKLSARGLNANGLWFSGYRIIRDCNFIIETIDQYRAQNETKADELKGQAYAIRAMVHHILVNVFAQPYVYTADASHIGIPYVISSDWRKPISRQKVSEVYSGIIEDFSSSIKLLPENTIRKTAINKNAAKALLARVYLFKGDFLNSNKMSVEVSKLVPIMVSTDYPNKLFTTEDNESLFLLPPAGGIAGYSTFYPGGYFRSSKQFIATIDIADILLENVNDARRSWVVNADGDFSITKFPVGVTGSVSSVDADYYYSIIRSSEMYLTAAESYAKLNMEDSAVFYLDAIRNRAGIAKLNGNIHGPALLDSIYKERRRELAFEGLRMSDLRRCQKEVKRIKDVSPGATYLPYPSSKAISPIPTSDVLLLGLKQNENY